MHQVYVIINVKDPVNIYVGTSVDANQRFIKHCSKSSRCRKLKNAIKRDGRESFRLEIVAEFRREDSAYAYEAELIARLKSEGHRLYNLTGGGKGAPDRTVRKRTRLKISEAMKAKNALVGLI